jgi:hypothetical protein
MSAYNRYNPPKPSLSWRQKFPAYLLYSSTVLSEVASCGSSRHAACHASILFVT